MSGSLINPDLEEKLNDINEIIQSELGFEPSAGGLLQQTNAEVCSCLVFQTLELPNGSLNNLEKVDANLTTCHQSSNIEDEIEVQIIGLKDIYNKKTRKTIEGPENRLEDSEVTVAIYPSEKITCVRAYVQRCPEAAIKTHDTIGPVEQHVKALNGKDGRQIFNVDIGSVYKTESGHPVYWLEKADVMQRNKWELIISMELSSGLTGNVTSRPFRVTTKASDKMRRKGDFTDISSTCEVQQLRCKPKNSPNILLTGTCKNRIPKIRTTCGVKKELTEEACSLSHDLTDFTVILKDQSQFQQLCANDTISRCASPTDDKIVFQEHTVLDKHAVTAYYSGEQRIHLAIEQPEIPGLLKLVAKLTDPRRKANGNKSADEDFWWACGRCFFERRKKSTIKAHVIQRVCQKSMENKKSRGKAVRRHLRRHFSCDFDEEKSKEYSWKNFLSV